MDNQTPPLEPWNVFTSDRVLSHALGGNGYVEEWPLARLYREAPLNSIWEGSEMSRF